MSYSTTVMIPPLYEAQKSIEEMAKKFGNNGKQPIRYDNGGGDPSKTRIDQFLSKLSDALYRFCTTRDSVDKLREQKLKTTKTYFTIFMVLLWVGGVSLFIVFGYDFIKKRNLYSKMEWMIAFCVGCIAIIMFVISTIYAVRLKEKSYRITRNLYGSDPFLQSSYITNLTNMMRIYFPKNASLEPTNSLRIDSNSPPLIFTLVKNRNIKLKTSSNIGAAACKDLLCAGTQNPLNAEFSKCDIHNGFIYPFVAGNPIPYDALRKDLEAYDLYGQLKRLRDAVTYLKTMVMKSSDSGGTDTSQPVISKTTEEYIRKRVVDVILIKHAITDQLYMDAKSTSCGEKVTAFGKEECHKSCLNDVNCVLSTYDSVQNQCTTFNNKAETRIDASFYVGDSGQSTLVKESNKVMPVLGFAVNKGSLPNVSWDSTKIRKSLCTDTCKVDKSYCAPECKNVTSKCFTDYVNNACGNDANCKTNCTSTTSKCYTDLVNMCPCQAGKDPSDTNDCRGSPGCLLNLSISSANVVKGGHTGIDLDTTFASQSANTTTFTSSAAYPSAAKRTQIASDKSFVDALSLDVPGQTSPVGALFVHYASLSAVATKGQKESLIESLSSLKDYFVQKIVNTVIENDSSASFMFSDTTVDWIVAEVGRRLGVPSKQYENYIRDLFNDVPTQLQAAMFAMQADMAADSKLLKYVPYDRFVDKMQQLKKDEFLTKFVYNIETVRATAKGINNLNKSFNMAGELNNIKNGLTDLLLMTIIVIGLFGILIVLFAELNSEFKYKSTLTKEENTTTKVSRYLSTTLKMALVVSLVVIVYHMVYGNKMKRDAKFQFNRNILEKNGMTIVNESNALMDTLYTLVKQDKFGTRLPNVPNETTPVQDLLYEKIFETSDKNKAKQISVIPGDPAMNEMYLTIVNIVDSYDKCNSLVTENMSSYPFPILDVSLYSVVIIVSVIALLVVFGQMDPFTHIQEIRKLTIVKSRLTRSLAVDTNDIGCHDTSKEMDEQMIITLKLIAIAFVIIFAIAFAQSVQTSSDVFTSGLYGSDLFINSECYGL